MIDDKTFQFFKQAAFQNLINSPAFQPIAFIPENNEIIPMYFRNEDEKRTTFIALGKRAVTGVLTINDAWITIVPDKKNFIRPSQLPADDRQNALILCWNDLISNGENSKTCVIKYTSAKKIQDEIMKDGYFEGAILEYLLEGFRQSK